MPAADQRFALGIATGVGALAFGLGIFVGRGTVDRAPAPPAVPAASPPAPAPPPPAVAAPPPAAEVPRDIGTPPWRAVALRIDRWTDRKGWAVRDYLTLERLRDPPEGTQIFEKYHCRVGDARFTEVAGVGPPPGPLRNGEAAPTWGDHFIWAPIDKVPDRCDVMIFVQMPGAKPDVIDHDAGHFCVTPTGDTFDIATGPCLE
jgi:hypothetical protein